MGKTATRTAAVTLLAAMLVACSGGTEESAPATATPGAYQRPCYQLGAAGSEEVDCGDAEPGTVFGSDGEPIADDPTPGASTDVPTPDPAYAAQWEEWWSSNVETWFTMGNAIFDATEADVADQLAVALDAARRLDPMPDPDAQALLKVLKLAVAESAGFASQGATDLAFGNLEFLRGLVDTLVNYMPEPAA